MWSSWFFKHFLHLPEATSMNSRPSPLRTIGHCGIKGLDLEVEIPTTTVKPECARYPEEKVLFSSDNFPRNYEKVIKTL